MYLYILLLVTASLIPSSSSITVYVNDSSPLASNSTSCGPVTEPCQTLDLGLDVIQYSLKGHNVFDISVELIIADGEYDHTNTSNGVFNDMIGIRITGQGVDETGFMTTVNCANDSGFSFIESFSIIISGIEFIGCGQLQNSTSYASNTSFSLFYVGLYFLYCRDVNLTEVSVSDSQATGIVLYNIIGTNILDTLTVSNNIFTTDRGSGGGVYIEYSYCVPSGLESDIIDCLSQGVSNIESLYTDGSTFKITNSIFSNNTASVADYDSNTFPLPRGQFHAAFGRGGGLSIFFKGLAYDRTITIDRCTFKDNQAVVGGGLFIEFQDSVEKNHVSVSSTVFSQNRLCNSDKGTGGGGARVGYIFYGPYSSVQNNHVVFDKCDFRNNSAHYGGGVSFHSSYQSDDNYDLNINSFEVHNCNFTGNRGRIGAAFDLSLWHSSVSGQPPSIQLSNCSFIDNKNHDINDFVGTGIVYVDSLPIVFIGNMSFIDNFGSALVVTGTYVNVSHNTNMSFINNMGRHGGAIALLGNSFIMTSENSALWFINNSALYKGGAIYFFNPGEKNLAYSRNCFVRYYDITAHPNQWTATFYFEGNMISSGSNVYNSVYATAIFPCLWKKLNESRFYWESSQWVCHESGNVSNCQNQINSAPSSVDLLESSYEMFPGDTITLDLAMKDDLQHNVIDAMLVGRMDFDNNESNAFFPGYSGNNLKFEYISRDQLTLLGKDNSSVKIYLETHDPIVIQKTITVHMQACPPGFISSNNGTCDCPKGDYNGYVSCDESRHTIRIKKASWLGKVNNYDSYLVGLSPYVTSSSSSSYILLPQDPNELDKTLCNNTNRRGVLCGRCMDNYGVAINSLDSNCVQCPDSYVHYHWFFYLLTEFLPVTLFFAVVFLFSMTVTNGPLNSYILFAQLITSCTDIDADGMIPLQSVAESMGVSYNKMELVYYWPYDIWNLNFFKSLFPDFCLSASLNTVDVQALRYITAVYPLLLLVMLALVLSFYNKGARCIVSVVRPFHNCVSRFRQFTNLHQSVIGGVAVVLLISYTKFAYVSLLLLSPTPLYYSNGTTATYVFYPDGNIEWGKTGSSKLYIVIAVCMLSTFVLLPPLILFYPTLLRIIERLSFWRLRLGRLYPSPKFQAFLDEFHGCYKDGSNGGIDCRWFASFYFCLRIVLYAVYSIATTWYIQYAVQLILFLGSALLVALFQPYRRSWINQVDITIFLILATVISLSQYNLLTLWVGSKSHLETWPYIIQYVLILLPLVYCVCYYCIVIGGRLRERFILQTRMRRKRKQIQKQQSATAANEDTERKQPQHGIEYQDSLVDSTHVPEFLEYIEESSRFRNIKLPNVIRSYSSRRTSRRQTIEDYLEVGTGESSPLLSASPNESEEDEESVNDNNTNRDEDLLLDHDDQYLTACSTSTNNDTDKNVSSTVVYLQ